MDADDFLRGHLWAILATSGRDGSPQQSIVELLDEQQRTALRMTPTSRVFHE